MTRKPISIGVDSSVLEAIRSFLDHKVSSLPVLNQDGSVAGILTWRDILKAIAATVEKAHVNKQKS